jgi:hypothetical protein
MLVTFRTKAYSNITLFGDVAVRLLKLMGHSGTVPSALKAEDVPAALQRLRAAIAKQKTAPTDSDPGQDRDDDAEPVVALAHRALPLMELLQAAAAQNSDVMWDS